VEVTLGKGEPASATVFLDQQGFEALSKNSLIWITVLPPLLGERQWAQLEAHVASLEWPVWWVLVPDE